jgi:hypothetical protein
MAESSRATGIQDEVLNSMRMSQAAIVAAIGSWASMVQSVRPELPELKLPFAARLPKPEELVANAYDFGERLLANQREFAQDVLHAAAPLRATGQCGATAAQ